MKCDILAALQRARASEVSLFVRHTWYLPTPAEQLAHRKLLRTSPDLSNENCAEESGALRPINSVEPCPFLKNKVSSTEVRSSQLSNGQVRNSDWK